MPNVDLTQEQLNTVLSAMHDKKLENETYLNSWINTPEEPQEHNTCCSYHLQKWQKSQDMKKTLQKQGQHINEIIDTLTATQ